MRVLGSTRSGRQPALEVHWLSNRNGSKAAIHEIRKFRISSLRVKKKSTPAPAPLSLALYCLDMRAAQSQVKTYLSLDGPPIVKKYLHGSPHRNPADDGQAFARDAIAGTGTKIADEIGGDQTERNKEDAYRQARAALLQHLMKFSACTFGLIDEVIMDRFGQHPARVAIFRPLFKVDGEVEAAIVRMS